MKENFIYFLKNFLFYFTIGICASGPMVIFIFPVILVTAAAIICATIATMNRSEKIFTKHFWFAVIPLIIFWIIISNINTRF